MKNLWFAVLLVCRAAHGQQVVTDPQHLAAVSENAVVRSTAEATHEQYLTSIGKNIDELNTNVASVVLAQTIVYNALSNVNSALKYGLAVKNLAVIISDMQGYIARLLQLARGEPYLLLFAGNIAGEMGQHAVLLLSDVQGFILKQGDNVLADFGARDQLLRQVTRQLQVMDGLAYGAWRAVYWARQRGIAASANPFASYINRDKTIVSRIIQNAKYLNQ